MPILAAPQKQPQRLKMIEQAMKDQAPKMYAQMKESGRLQAFLENYDDQMMESYEEATTEVTTNAIGPKGPKDYMETVQQITMGNNRAWEETLATWLEFQDPPTTGSEEAS